MSRPLRDLRKYKDNERINAAFRIPVKVLKAVDDLCRANYRTRSQELNRLVELGLKHDKAKK